MSLAQPGLIIQLGEIEGALTSPSSREPVHDKVPLIQSMFSQVVEKNQKMELNMEAQSESHLTPEQKRLLSAMDLEKSKLKIAFSNPIEISMGSSRNFKTINLNVHTHKLLMLDKVNLHMQTGQLIVNDLYKKNETVAKVEKMLNKLIQQLKLEKSNSRDLNAQVDELKKIIIKIGVNPNDQPIVKKLLQSTKLQIGVLTKKLNLPIGEHPLAAGIVEVENEKENLLQDVLQKTEEVSLLKETLDKLQRQVMPSNTDDPAMQDL